MPQPNDASTSVWCSELTGAALDAYFGDPCAADTPFAIDVGQAFDHDFLERIESAEHGSSTVGELIRRTGSGHELAEALGPHATLPARTVVVLYRVEVSGFPTEREGMPHPLRHLGNVPTPKELAR